MMVQNAEYYNFFKMSREDAEREIYHNGVYPKSPKELENRTLTLEETASGRAYTVIPDCSYPVKCSVTLAREYMLGFSVDTPEPPMKWMEELASKGIVFENIYEKPGGPYFYAENTGNGLNIKVFDDFTARRDFLMSKEDLFKPDTEKDFD